MTTQTNATEVAVAEHARGIGWMVAVLRTARPRQWPKNLLVFAAPLAGASLGRRDGLLYALAAAAAFGFASVAVYFVNDVVDAERDRRHPRKRNRPVASGALPKQHAVALGAVCAAVGLAIGALISEPLLIATVAGYLALSFLYSLVLKHLPVVEVMFVASGFLLRVLGGAAATHVPPSKMVPARVQPGRVRRGHRQALLRADQPRRRGDQAPPGDALLPARRGCDAQIVVGAGMIAAYLAWAAGEDSGARIWHLASALPLALALVRFGFLTGRRTAAAVEDLIMRDAPMLASELSWLALFVTGLYQTGG